MLVGGQGTRLRPLTARRHKSLVPLFNRPAIEHLFDWLRKSGIERVVLAIGQHNEDLALAYPEGTHRALRIQHVMEQERLESGGAIRFAVQRMGIDERFIVLNGDVYLDFDLGEALQRHEALEAELTLALTPVEDPSSFGVAVVDHRSLITGFVEKPPEGTAPSNLINAGAWIFERETVEKIPPGAVRVEETLFPWLVQEGRQVHGFVSETLWADIGTPARYLELTRQLVNRNGQCLAPDCVIAPGATVTGSVVGPATRVADGASLRDSVTWEDVRINSGAAVELSILADGVTIGHGAIVRDSVLGPGVRVTKKTKLEGATVDADATV